MRANMAEQPAAIGTLVDCLFSQGFVLVNEEYAAEHFGDWLRTLEAPPLRVVIARERGRWDIGAGLSDGGPVYSLVAWSECLGLTYGDDPWSSEAQARFLREYLATMAEEARQNQTLGTCLDRAERSLLARAIGLPEDIRLDGVGRLEPPGRAEALQREASTRLARDRRRRKTRGS